MKSVRIVCVLLILTIDGYLFSEEPERDEYRRNSEEIIDVGDYDIPAATTSQPPIEAQNEPAHNPREQEIRDFFVKFLNKAKQHRNITRFGFSPDQIKKLLGQGNHLIVFSCDKPGYMDLRRKENFKESRLVRELNARASCSISHAKDDGLWLRDGDEYSPITYDHLSKFFSRPPLPMKNLILYFLQLDLCDDFMRFMRHPGYYLSKHRKPKQCQTLKSQTPKVKNTTDFENKSVRPPKQKEAKFFAHHHFLQRFQQHPQQFHHPFFQQQHFQQHPFFQQQQQQQHFQPQFQFGGFQGGCAGGG